ncbi:MAG TPA: hypothetical protein VK992_05470, partial [Candidatus Caenarcaniphilales bacterium]|nr:hypothetical protein [Candidatus Caenarcaniphilales bacterium]
TIFTGNPQTDLDFFTQRGETFASVGTLAIGGNQGGQTIVQLTRKGGRIVDPRRRSGHPSATCLSDPVQALGLQHDVEAAPKGSAILNTRNRFASRRDAQILLDATDNPGRCHDQGVLGLIDAPNGGLEIIDITNIDNPVEIGLTSHIGEAHTVNVDPKRPHIAYAVTSDAIGVSNGKRENEDPSDSDRFDLDGFEVVDLSSCMYFRAGTSVEAKRAACRPEVFRYRYPRTRMALGHTQKSGQQAVFGCHELEIYPEDKISCGSGNAAIALDISKAFDDNGTPRKFTDDKPRGTALPCRVRDSSSEPPFRTGAKVTDCVVGGNGEDLTVPGWITLGRPSLTGVRWIGSVHHQGRGAGGAVRPANDATEDIDFNHETEFTRSRKFLLATDERGGGVVPPGATCTSLVDLKSGNGGVHAYRVDRLTRRGPRTASQAQRAYARTPRGAKAIFRARPRTVVEPTFCTAHVMQQVPGQNRIFMGWYTQGTQVIDFVEHRNGRFEFREAGFFIPELANQWVSHVFKVRKNRNGTFTYWGATGDFNIDGKSGRNAVDVYRVTLPAPPKAAARQRAGNRRGERRARPRFTG